jgi:DDE domain
MTLGAGPQVPFSSESHIGVRKGSVALTGSPSARSGRVQPILPTRRPAPSRSAFAGFRFPPEVIVLAVRWYCGSACPTATSRSYSPSAASTLTTSPCTAGFSGSPRCWPTRPGSADTGSAIAGTWTRPPQKVCERWVCLYRAVDQFGQVIDVYASTRRDGEAARLFFQRARTTTGVTPTEVITDRAPTYPRVLDHLWPAVWHHVERYANNRVEADHAQLKRRLRPMRGIKTMTGLRVLAAGHAFVQNLRRGHYEIAANQRRNRRLPVAFCEWPRQSKVLHRTTGHPGLRHARLMQQTPGHHGSAAQAPSLMSIIDVRRPKS